jgi:RNA ligase (TIGR02306 family)
MRKLASIRRIADILPIEGADAIEVAVVDGWKVVIKKGEFAAGDSAIYLEIDSWVPHELAPFLSKGSEPREYNGVKGERLRTVKLRGQISQGLLLSLSTWAPAKRPWTIAEEEFEEGKDLTEYLGIQKWEPEIPAQLAGQVRGLFPTHLIPKTDQERIQNCFAEVQDKGDLTYEVTLKLDGTSCTIFRWENELRVCSRNLELKVNEENKDNTLVAMALKLGDKVKDGTALQGEVMGPGIQKNREGFKEHQFFVFDIYDIEEQEYLPPYARRAYCERMGIEHVPVFFTDCLPMKSVEQYLILAEGPSINHPIREGVVFKCNDDPSFSFKTISNKFLLKGGD